VNKVDKIQLLGMISRRILPENTAITIWTKMQVKISSTNLVSNMNSYRWKLSREYIDASTPRRKTEALPEIFKKSF
jgi:hypothetical protein